MNPGHGQAAAGAGNSAVPRTVRKPGIFPLFVARGRVRTH